MRCLALLGTLNGPHALEKEREREREKRERERERERARQRERENSRYSGMAGKDASRAMSTGNFKQDATPSLHGLLGAPRSALVAAFYLLEPPYDLRRNQACSKSEVFPKSKLRTSCSGAPSTASTSSIASWASFKAHTPYTPQPALAELLTPGIKKPSNPRPESPLPPPNPQTLKPPQILKACNP